MDRRVTESNEYRELVRIIAAVRRRWRLKLALRGAATASLVLLLAFLVTAFAIGEVAFAPAAVMTARLGLLMLCLGILGALVLLPLWRPVSDERVALYLEEREPSLRLSLLSALSAGGGEQIISPALARRTIETAVVRCRAIDSGRGLERRSLLRSGGLLAGVTAIALLLTLQSPDFVRLGARALFLPLHAAEAVDAPRLSVLPGDTSIARGADLVVDASAHGFRPAEAELYARRAGAEAFDRLPMPRLEEGGFQLRLFSLEEEMEYFVESQGVRSATYRVGVVDLPYVARLELELVFPAYTGLEPQRIENGGDVYAPVGTRVELRAHPTMAVPGGRVTFEGGASIELAPGESGTLTAGFTIREGGIYRIQLDGAEGEPIDASPEYLIEIMADQAPSVVFDDPGRDIKVTLVDEVYLEARATDDFGVRRLELHYSVNGGEERMVELYAARPMTEVSAGHTFYLEELELRPGDFIAYYARATDVGPGPRRPVSSDMYFVEVRPFGVEYRQSEGPPGGGGGGGGQADQSGEELTQRQRELISATFNTIRDRGRGSERDYRRDVEALASAQAALRRQALTLTERLSNRGAVRDSTFDVIAEALPRAAAEMLEAVNRLTRLEPEEALPAEQRALVHLQRAEAAYREVQVSLGQQGGGGGSSSGAGPSAEDLADLFGLELDQLRNQYETVQRGRDQQTASEIDASLDRVRELARRLEREDERLRQSAANQLGGGGGGGASQRQMADETMEEARRLERLSREQQRPDLMEVANQLREASEAIRRAAAESRSGNAGPRQQALDRLRDAGRRLERNQARSLQGEADDLARRARRLAEEQRRIAAEMETLPTSGNRSERVRDLIDRKEEQVRELNEMRAQLDRLASGARQEQPDAARRFRAAAETIREHQLPERIRASRAGTQSNMPAEYGRRVEQEIQVGLDELSERAEGARMAIGDGARPGDEGLDRARSLVRGMQSLQERLREGSPEGGGEVGEGREGRGESSRAGRGEAEEGANPTGERAAGRPGEQGQRPSGEQGQRQTGEPGQGQSEPSGRPGEQNRAGQPDRPGGGGEPGRAEGQASPAGGALGGVNSSEGGFGYGGRSTPWYGDPDQIRQLRSELRQRIAEGEALRQQLAAEGYSIDQLDAAIRDLRDLDSDVVFQNSDRLPQLQAAVLDRLKQFEFDLYRQVRGAEVREIFLSGGGEVPPEYRELVERYYRELAERR